MFSQQSNLGTVSLNAIPNIIPVNVVLVNLSEFLYSTYNRKREALDR